MISEYIANLKIKQYGGSFISCPSSWAATHVTSSYHKLYFPVSGEARITAKGHTHFLKERQLMLIPKGVTHSFSLTESCQPLKNTGCILPRILKELTFFLSLQISLYGIFSQMTCLQS